MTSCSSRPVLPEEPEVRNALHDEVVLTDKQRLARREAERGLQREPCVFVRSCPANIWVAEEEGNALSRDSRGCHSLTDQTSSAFSKDLSGDF